MTETPNVSTKQKVIETIEYAMKGLRRNATLDETITWSENVQQLAGDVIGLAELEQE